MKHITLLIACVALVATGCSAHKAVKAIDRTPRGGTLRVVLPSGNSFMSQGDPRGLDPQIAYIGDEWEVLRCMLRTLLSHTGQSTQDGGSVLRPDLAARMPDVSADGLTWTFTLKRGIHYAPPFQTTEMTSADFVRAFNREAKIGKDSYAFYFTVIRGFSEYQSGKSDSISGIATPDKYTLVLHLTQPTGDFGDRLILPGTAPIPPLPSNPSASFGAATGHDDKDGPFIVATGPYMLLGSEALDFSLAPKQQKPAAGYEAGKLYTLVRNPSWVKATDDLRPAYVDSIQINIVDDDPAARTMIETGAADVFMNTATRDDATVSAAKKIRSNPQLGSVLVGQGDFIYYISMRLAQPPFDDVNVRRAVSYVIDKTRLQQLWGGPYYGSIATHTSPDSLEDNLLVAYDPYKTTGEDGDVALARAEMAKSKYDANHDGLCDAAVCNDVLALTHKRSVFPAMGKEIEGDLAKIGIHVHLLEKGDDYGDFQDPSRHVALLLSNNWGKDFINASNFFSPLYDNPSNPDFDLVGAPPAELRSWGFKVRSVPNIHDRVGHCEGIVGTVQIQCWASLDQYVMEAIVPNVPYIVLNHVSLLSSRVVASSYDQFPTQPALDRIALRPGSS